MLHDSMIQTFDLLTFWVVNRMISLVSSFKRIRLCLPELVRIVQFLPLLPKLRIPATQLKFHLIQVRFKDRTLRSDYGFIATYTGAKEKWVYTDRIDRFCSGPCQHTGYQDEHVRLLQVNDIVQVRV